MKKTVLLILLFGFFSSTSAQNGESTIAIFYLTRTQNTKAVAEIIQNQIGGDLVALELENPYPEDYQAHVNQVVEENASGFLPPLKTKVEISKYDRIFIGFPTWRMQLPPPIKSFLNKYDLSGKTVIPFNTHAGYGVGSGFRQVKQLCPNSIVLGGLSLKGGHEKKEIYLAIKNDRAIEVEKEVKQWLTEIIFVVNQQ